MSGRIGLVKTAGMVWVAPVGAPSLPMMETVGREAILKVGLGPDEEIESVFSVRLRGTQSMRVAASHLGRRAALNLVMEWEVEFRRAINFT